MRKLIGTKHFYRKLLWLAVPIMVQNAITNFVGFLDNIMVGQLGTEQMSGVAIVNQLVFVFNLLVFGGLSGAGIFGAQFYGNGDHEGVRDTFRFKLITGIVIVVLTLTVLLSMGDMLIRLYLTSGEAENLQATFEYGRAYLTVILLEIVPFVMVQIYASTLRETGQTLVPMVAGVVAVFVNLIFNYIFIFGKFGVPAMGVQGAALATVLSRLTECGIVMIWTHVNREKNLFIKRAYASLRLPKQLAFDILRKGSPLLLNEVLWSAGIAMVNQCYSLRGYTVMTGTNIAGTIGNLFNVVFIALGSAVAIMVGQQLGASEFDKAMDTAGKVIFFSVCCTILTSGIMIAVSGAFPGMYNTSEDVKHMAGAMIRITAVMMPIQAFLHATYFTIRSGGRTVITSLFDSGFSWVVGIPFAYSLVHFTGLPILTIYTMYLSLDIIKATVGFILLKKGIWMQNIVS